jgi:hypothetical protein
VTPIKTYRLCRYDRANKIVTAEWLEAASDEEAVAKASAAGSGCKSELWDGERLIAGLGDEGRLTA